MKQQTFSFSVDTTVDPQSGQVMAVYFQLRCGKSAKTKVLCDGLMLADYDSKGTLLGVEMLGPCSGEVLDQITLDKPAKEFVRRVAPSEFLTGISANPMSASCV